MPNVPIKVLEHAKDLPLPEYGTLDSAGADLVAAIDHDVPLAPLERQLIPTGISIALPEGYEAQVRPRSGLALKHGLSIVNTPGTIDTDYRGEIGVIMINLSQEPFVITRGMRIAQLVLNQYERATWLSVSELPETERADGGFGSTGTMG